MALCEFHSEVFPPLLLAVQGLICFVSGTGERDVRQVTTRARVEAGVTDVRPFQRRHFTTRQVRRMSEPSSEQKWLQNNPISHVG